jgi:transposase
MVAWASHLRGAVHPIRWSKEFLEAGKRRLVGDTTREATSTEVLELRKENGRLKQLVAETVLENRLLKKSVTAADSDDEASA